MRDLPHYKQGPQGNLVPDFRAEYHQRYGKGDPDFVPGTPGIEDRRVVFNATEVGTMLLADRASQRNGGPTEAELLQALKEVDEALKEIDDPDEEDRGF